MNQAPWLVGIALTFTAAWLASLYAYPRWHRINYAAGDTIGLQFDNGNIPSLAVVGLVGVLGLGFFWCPWWMVAGGFGLHFALAVLLLGLLRSRVQFVGLVAAPAFLGAAAYFHFVPPQG
jgi:hypothetical protein